LDPATETGARRRKRILLVDDEVQNLELLEACLEPLGHETVRAQAGTEAIAFLDRVSFDLVLLDVMMPGATGFEVLRRFREKRTERCVPVVILTALVDRASRLRGLELGANDFLAKPLDRAELMTRVRSLLALQDATDTLLERSAELGRMKTRQHDREARIVRELSAPLDTAFANLAALDDAQLRPESLLRVKAAREATANAMRAVHELFDPARAPT
jgi:DNA-binding response OmpR family regulator